MLDVKWIRENPDAFVAGLEKRGFEPAPAGLLTQILALDAQRRETIQQLQDLQARRNAASKEIGKAKQAKDEAEAQRLMDEVAGIKDTIQKGEEDEREQDQALRDLLAGIPNMPADDVPVGPDESANVELRKVGEVPSFDFEPKQHFEIGEGLGLMDFETAAKLSGARFVVLKGALARLERALAQFMLDLHTDEHGYTEVNPPLLVRDDTMFGTAQLPKFEEDQFPAGEGYWLIPTAEVPLTNLVREDITDEANLPMRVTAGTACFRAEAGAAGARHARHDPPASVHGRWNWSRSRAGTAAARHERMTACAETVLKRLGLPYRVVVLSTGDMGFSARKTFDIEVWLPGQDAYREISSCSVCGDFQARRMNARYRPAESKAARLVHTLNGSGVAVGRALIAVLENYQEADGGVRVPDVLQPYMGGLTKIEAPS
ncbi:MAG: serine--tRNA ligase [Methyloceanibacter sp.]|nr:MAG: serine--tRNA ligase [Methyloceanibacter sp.]